MSRKHCIWLKEQYKSIGSKPSNVLTLSVHVRRNRGDTLMLESVLQHTEKAWRYWLSRRSHKSAIPWEQFSKLKESFPLPVPRIVHNI
jgi:hypothetical protein